MVGTKTPGLTVQFYGSIIAGDVVGSQPIDPTTNEVGEFPNLLTRLVLEGRLVTGDAHYTNPTVARSIREKGGTIS
jgi:hypothetical protein